MTEEKETEPIAIIGTACRFSGEASSMRGLWDMISNEKTGHCKIPHDRWDADLLYHPDPDRKGTMAVKHGYFLQQNIKHFDAPFFQTTAKEAASMDPMKRLLLEVGYESLENAGILIDSLIDSQTGCCVGCMTNDYEMLASHDMQNLGYTAGTSNSEAMTANRLSWFFALRCPSLTLDTACSSSLYALHLACQSLKLGESDMFLVAGVNLILYPNTMQQFSAIHMLSPEGHWLPRVKRLSDALRDGDTIRAVVRNTGTNADGKTPSITAPSPEAQADLIRRTYASAGLDMASTHYFESHGTGTPVGGPIECQAIASTIGAARADAGLGPLYVGSIKPNNGHTEGCAGIAGLLKAILCLEKGMLVPTYDVRNINPKLKLDEWNLRLPARSMKFPSTGVRRISVNSFGFGGANAHAILDDAHHYLRDRGLVGNHNTTVYDDGSSDSGLSMGQGTPPSPASNGDESAPHLFVLSSRDQGGNDRMAKAHAAELDGTELASDETEYLQALAYTLAERRS